MKIGSFPQAESCTSTVQSRTGASWIFRRFQLFLLIASWIVSLSPGSAEVASTPRRDFHMAEAKFRALTLRDENGQVPDNALLNALAQKKLMRPNLAAWPGASGSRPAGLKIAGIDTN